MFQKLHVAVVHRLTLKKRRDDRVGASLPFHTDWCSLSRRQHRPLGTCSKVNEPGVYTRFVRLQDAALLFRPSVRRRR